jgi:hypothetical protein
MTQKAMTVLFHNAVHIRSSSHITWNHRSVNPRQGVSVGMRVSLNATAIM